MSLSSFWICASRCAIAASRPAHCELGDSVCIEDGYAPGPVWYTKGDVSGSPSNPGGPGTNVPVNPLTLAYQKGFAAGLASASA